MSVKINSTGGGSVTLDSGSTANNVTLSLPGTAGTVAALASVTNNGVAYVNSSGQPTSGSALTFDGTNLSVGGAPVNGIPLTVFQTASSFGIRAASVSGASPYVSVISGDGYRFGFNTAAAGGPVDFKAFDSQSMTWTIGSEQMRLTSTGLGIGTSSPGQKLEVYGTLRVRSATEILDISAPSGKVDLNNLAGDPISFSVGSTERMRLDSSGNVGIGTSSPAQKLDVNGGARFATSNWVQFGTNNTFYADSSYGLIIKAPATSNFIAFRSSDDTERMRIDSSGNLLVGTTSSGGWSGNQKLAAQSATSWALGAYNSASTGSGSFLVRVDNAAVNLVSFYYGASSQVGTITTNGTNTTYGTTSDYRLKENIKPMQNALTVVQQLNPVTYTWKADGSDGQGFIAHELQAVVPDCVTGTKDAVDEEGNPVYQGVDTSFLVATLTKAIQELSAKVDAQASEIAALKAK